MSTKVTTEQLAMVQAWAAQGIDLNGIQKRLAAECGVHMTYMDVRFLLLDHGLEIAAAEEPKPSPAEEKPQEAPAEAADIPAPAGSKPVVTLDELQLPGTLISGKVAFPSGTHCAWQIDQMGRFGWLEQSAPPTPEELQAFQFELTQLLSR